MTPAILAALVVAAPIVLLSRSCTAGYLTDSSGNAYDLGGISSVYLYNAGNGPSYSTSAWPLGGMEAFSFDPAGPNDPTSSTKGNSPYQVASGSYWISVTSNYGETHYTSPYPVKLGQYGACPASDYFTNAATNCQLLQIKVYPGNCSNTLPGPYQDGDVYVVAVGPPSCD